MNVAVADAADTADAVERKEESVWGLARLPSSNQQAQLVSDKAEALHKLPRSRRSLCSTSASLRCDRTCRACAFPFAPDRIHNLSPTCPFLKSAERADSSSSHRSCSFCRSRTWDFCWSPLRPVIRETFCSQGLERASNIPSIRRSVFWVSEGRSRKSVARTSWASVGLSERC